MKIIRSPKQMQGISKEIKDKGKTIGFVPTMGALHQGHLSLIRRARQDTDVVVVSIFVNPTQFGPQEDFQRYPRPFRKDISLCRSLGVDYIFHPLASWMYPEGFKTYVLVEDLSEVLCGRFRPGHFRGVTTVVAKLFNIVRPDIAYFGQKDAQQAIIIKRMVCDLNFPLKIKVMPIIREEDGLALSSRNIYLSPQERNDACVLSEALRLAQGLVKSGIKDTKKIICHMRALIKKKKSAKIDYIAIVDPKTLKPVKKISGRCLLALAVWIGKTRLIDNLCLKG
ncbi:MAG: pantoate--beta-alanine ligase [Candidatus Omnitrophica bacterium]|nr:pantoate--beta-alanine ligase [Candidatus Omnitrophota bacterium]